MDIVSGELTSAPRNVAQRLVEIVSLWLVVRSAARSFARFALGRRVTGKVELRENALELTSRTTWLGREGRARVALYPLESITELALETGGPPARFSLGVGALALGTLLGSGLVVQAFAGSRAAPELLGIGLGLMVVGLLVDYLLERGVTSDAPARLVLTARRGSGWSLRGVRPDAARRLLDELSPVLGAPQGSPDSALTDSAEPEPTDSAGSTGQNQSEPSPTATK